MLSLSAIQDARERIADAARVTPMEYSHTFSDRTGAAVHLKLENLQRTGAFKIRGATNRIETLSAAQQDAGVVTASAGNHAQGVALAATRAGVDATIVMPEHAPISKIQATRGYGARVVLEGVDYDAAQAHAHEIEREENRTYVHAFDDEMVMAGQGTIGLEIVDQQPDVETVIVPIGGGGLIAGVATAIKTQQPDVRVIGVQAEGAASVSDSLETGEIQSRESVDTIADGIATRSVGERPFEVIETHVDEIVTVSDEEIALAITLLLERSKIVVEGAGAVALSALLEDRFEYEPGEVIVPALCGGNIDMNVLTTVILRGMIQLGRYLKIRTVLPDQPGALEGLIEIIAEKDANIYEIHHERASREVGMSDTEVELELETHGQEHAAELLATLRDAGYTVDIVK